MSPKTPKVLIDHCTFVHGQTTRMVAIHQRLHWPNGESTTVKVTKLQGLRRGAGEGWLRDEVRSIRSIALAARDGRIVAMRSFELGAELSRSRTGRRTILGDLWSGVDFEHAPSPICRGAVMGGMSWQEVCSRQHQETFYLQLLKHYQSGTAEAIFADLPRTAYIVAQLSNLALLHEFSAICDSVGRKRLGDGFHLWTALCAGLDYFVTTDGKFLRTVPIEYRNGDMSCQALSPTELLEVLDLAPSDLPIAEGSVSSFAMA